MNKYINDSEYVDIVNDILNNKEFKKLKKYKHHGDNRMDHCIRVSYYSYKIAKKLKLRYKEIARAGLLHDFFFVNNQEISFFTRIKVLFNHPRLAVINSNRHFKITKLEESMILSHVFPIGVRLPVHIESWVLDLVDDYFSIYERIKKCR